MAFTDTTQDSPRFYAGRMLLAMPGMADMNFDHAAIAMCVHDENGALGIDVGSVIDGLSVAELMSNFDIAAPDLAHVPVMRGGPVDPQRGFVLHSLDWSGQESVQVNDRWALSGSLDVLKAIAGDAHGPERYIVSLGYSGWTAGQLEHEMTHHGWFLGGEIAEDLAAIPPVKRWGKSFSACGVDTRLLAGAAGRA